jgi:hypothetical protein
MPQIGELIRGTKVGINSSNLFIWQSCTNCGKERWVKYIVSQRRPFNTLCKHCANSLNLKGKRGSVHPSWNTGEHLDEGGYKMVILYPDDFYYPMAKSGYSSKYVQEHRLVMAKKLSRLLCSSEIVHHINGIRVDNRIENLELITKSEHVAIHNGKGAYRGIRNKAGFKHKHKHAKLSLKD